ncbi:hypothetical protein [Nocardia vulneris]|uniref:Uncharacterized protein n=1 Tax=Nocardia vulneris TaxID=1141657 RepID=A0ABR4ZCG0_9NOCA|nr:hypothetical protein [Nocardia vulneris]KIA63048.1 hypothetical protein FG87_22075 [Nocardia vulneris]
MSESYRVRTEHRFATGQVLRVGDLFRDNDNSSIRDMYRVKAIRDYRRSGLHVVLTIIRREHNGEATEPMTECVWPIAALFDDDDRVVPVEAGDQR